MRCKWLLLALLACEHKQEVVQARVQAIDVGQAASLGTAASAPASTPVHHEATNRELCDRTYTADKAPRLSWPPPGGSGAIKGPTWINLWAAWCKPCVAEIPELKAWAEEGGFGMYFVSMDDDQREWKQGAEKLALSDGSMWLPPGKGRTQWLKPLGYLDVPNLPAQVLVDGERRLRCFRSGAIEAGEKAAFLAYLKTL